MQRMRRNGWVRNVRSASRHVAVQHAEHGPHQFRGVVTPPVSDAPDDLEHCTSPPTLSHRSSTGTQSLAARPCFRSATASCWAAGHSPPFRAGSGSSGRVRAVGLRERAEGSAAEPASTAARVEVLVPPAVASCSIFNPAVSVVGTLCSRGQSGASSTAGSRAGAPGLRSRRQITALAAKIVAAHQRAVVYPCTASSRWDGSDGGLPAASSGAPAGCDSAHRR
jgi:hypothetical protein